MSKVMEYVEGYTQDPVTKKLERVACYIRVSTQEQKLHGISLNAQRDKLVEFAKTHNLKIVEWYEDEGISGRKLIKNRPQLQRMIKDAQAGKFDRIIFIKLDRFFRSVAEYHECMKLIDPVLWTATEEKYDLTTANGRAFVNMKITIAELEADQTGERINIVNDYKIKTGQAITGSHNQLYGYTVKKIDGVKRVVKDPETAHIVEDYINHYLIHHNKNQAHRYIVNKYNITIGYVTLSKLLSDTKLYGSFKGNDEYIKEPYVDINTFIKLQEIQNKNIKKTSANRTYLFTGLVKCPNCNRTMVGKYIGGTIHNKRPNGKVYNYDRNYYYYRCNSYYRDKCCNFNRQVNESIIENDLLNKLEYFIKKYFADIEDLEDNAKESNTDTINRRIKDVKTEMSNSVKSFNKGRMTEAEHDREYEALERELHELESQLQPLKERDITLYEDVLKSNWRTLYSELTKENKRIFWRKYIKAIELNPDGTVKQPIFF